MSAKIVVIGAGSASFGLANLSALLRTPQLSGSELCLVDTNPAGLRLVTGLAERINREWDARFEIRSAVDRTECLPGASFVILSVAVDREKCWKLDQDIAKKHGIIHYAENGGPGAVMHTARNIALIMPILRDIERLCPGALVLNFTNPVPRVCIAAARFTSVSMVGICHQIGFGYSIVAAVLAKDLGFRVPPGYKFRWDPESMREYKRIAHEAEERIDILAAGLNHFTWMLAIRDRRTGADLYPLFERRYREGHEDFEPLTRELFQAFKICPVPGDCHLVEYLPYTHSPARRTWEKYDIQMYPFAQAEASRDARWADIREMAEGKKPIDSLRDVRTERAELILAATVTGQHRYEQAVNLPNKGYIENLPPGAIVEVPADVGASGVHGVGVGKLPEPVAELCRRQIAVAEIAVRAAVTGDRDQALQALLLDPMIDDPRVARELLDDYLKAEEQWLPQFFNQPAWL